MRLKKLHICSRNLHLKADADYASKQHGLNIHNIISNSWTWGLAYIADMMSVCLQPLTFVLDGQEWTVALTQWGEAAASQDSLRAAAMMNMSPIHSYLFSSDGNLLHANEPACSKIKKSGEQPLSS